MTGYNMPPGVCESDIPGNSAEAQAAEVRAEERYALFFEKLKPLKLRNELIGRIIAALDEALEERENAARSAGYMEAQGEEELAQALSEAERTEQQEVIDQIEANERWGGQ